MRERQNSVEAKRRIAENGGRPSGVEGLLAELELCWLYLKTSGDPIAQDLRISIEAAVGEGRVAHWRENLDGAGSSNGQWAEAGWPEERQRLAEGLIGRMAGRAHRKGDRFRMPAWVSEAPPQPGAA